MTHPAPTSRRRHEPGGVVAMQAAVMAFVLHDAGVKWLLQDYAVPEVLALRSSIVLIVAGIYLAVRGRLLSTCRIDQPLQAFGRGALIAGAFLSYFTALSYMPLADVQAIFYAAPLIQSVMSKPMLGEAVGWRRQLPILIGFAGVLIMVGPAGAIYGWPVLAAVLAAGFYAGAMVWSRALGPRVTPLQLTLTTNLVFLVVGGIMAPFVWVTPTPMAGGLLLGLAALSFLGHLGLATAYKRSPVAIVAPLEYTAMPLAVLVGFMIWGNLPTWGTIAGVPLVIGSGAFIIWQERRESPGSAAS